MKRLKIGASTQWIFENMGHRLKQTSRNGLPAATAHLLPSVKAQNSVRFWDKADSIGRSSFEAHCRMAAPTILRSSATGPGAVCLVLAAMVAKADIAVGHNSIAALRPSFGRSHTL